MLSPYGIHFFSPNLVESCSLSDEKRCKVPELLYLKSPILLKNLSQYWATTDGKSCKHTIFRFFPPVYLRIWGRIAKHQMLSAVNDGHFRISHQPTGGFWPTYFLQLGMPPAPMKMLRSIYKAKPQLSPISDRASKASSLPLHDLCKF